MSTMKAIAKQSTRPDDIAFTEAPVPEIGPHEILVKIRAVGVGIHDGYFLPEIERYPYPIGIEAAGVVQQIGPNVANRKPGDRVAFISVMEPKGGVWAEYAAVADGSLIIPIPNGMTFTDAAAIPVAAHAALRALQLLHPKPGDTLFIAGASGAIGTFAIPLAVEKGYRVAASASAANHEYMKSLGVEKAVDYRDAHWVEQVKAWSLGGVDAAIGIQPGAPAACLPAVKDGGAVIIVSGDTVTPERGIRVEQIAPDTDVRQELTDLYKRIAAGEIRLVVEKVYPFEDGLDALRKTQTRHARGKVVLTLE